MIFGEFRNRTDVQLKAYVSYLELYNEAGYDLLDPSHETKALEDLPKVSMFEDENGSFHFKNLSVHPADSEEDALNLLFTGDTNRAIAETPMNMVNLHNSACISMLLLFLVPSDDVCFQQAIIREMNHFNAVFLGLLEIPLHLHYCA
jgi:kinesin family protein 6/9